jgi:predicted O-linked N-acetylglucosamine transferase (SPINDLY family)
LYCHPVGALLLPVLTHHDRKNVEVFCYANVSRPDEQTQKLRQAADVWRDTLRLSDAQLAEQIRKDGIDILVDLALHGDGHRLLAFARKPAPVQVTWLGYAGTTGLGAMDYRLSDPYLDPPGEDEPYSERTLRLPHCFWNYSPYAEAMQVSELPALKNQFVTFGCFNNFAKASEVAQRLWAQVLAATPKSRMLIEAPPGEHRAALQRLFAEYGVAGDRVEFFPRVSLEEYFRLYQRVDLCLDPTPFGGGTTTFDSLWMGVAVVSLLGRTVAGRGGASILSNLGLPELIARTPQEYVAIATGLAADLPRLAALRSGLRQKMQQSPLTDITQFTVDLEAAFRQMWVDWCKAR